MCNSQSFLNIPPNSEAFEMIRLANIIIWDEAPSINKAIFECVDRSFRAIMNNDNVFGGKLIVFGGDFKQTLPIIKNGSYADTINACLHTSYLWPHLLQRKLVKNMRITSQSHYHYIAFLRNLGQGNLQQMDSSDINIPPYIRITQDISTAISFVYPELDHPDSWTNKCILVTTNEKMQQINKIVADLLPGNSKLYRSYDSAVYNNDLPELTDEFLNSIDVPGLPPHNLYLKINMPVMLIRNLSPKQGLCNGTILRIIQMLPVSSLWPVSNLPLKCVGSISTIAFHIWYCLWMWEGI